MLAPQMPHLRHISSAESRRAPQTIHGGTIAGTTSHQERHRSFEQRKGRAARQFSRYKDLKTA